MYLDQLYCLPVTVPLICTASDGLNLVKIIGIRELEENNIRISCRIFCSSSRRDGRCIVGYVPVITRRRRAKGQTGQDA